MTIAVRILAPIRDMSEWYACAPGILAAWNGVGALSAPPGRLVNRHHRCSWRSSLCGARGLRLHPADGLPSRASVFSWQSLRPPTDYMAWPSFRLWLRSTLSAAKAEVYVERWRCINTASPLSAPPRSEFPTGAGSS